MFADYLIGLQHTVAKILKTAMKTSGRLPLCLATRTLISCATSNRRTGTLSDDVYNFEIFRVFVAANYKKLIEVPIMNVAIDSNTEYIAIFKRKLKIDNDTKILYNIGMYRNSVLGVVVKNSLDTDSICLKKISVRKDQNGVLAGPSDIKSKKPKPYKYIVEKLFVLE